MAKTKLHPNVTRAKRDATIAIQQAKTKPIAIAHDTFCVPLIPDHLHITRTKIPHLTAFHIVDKLWRSHPIYDFRIDDDNLLISRHYTRDTKVRISLYDPKIQQKINRYTRKPKSGVANHEQ